MFTHCILHWDGISQSWSICEAWGYVRTEVIGKDIEGGGYNIFGQKLPPIVRDLKSETLKYQLGNALYNTKSLSDAHKYMKKHKLIQILNIH